MAIEGLPRIDQADWDVYGVYLRFPMVFAVLPFMTAPLLLAKLLIAPAGGWTARVLSGRSRASHSTIAEVARCERLPRQ